MLDIWLLLVLDCRMDNTFNTSELLERAAEKAGGITALAAKLSVTYQAVRKWQKRNRMPRTEWTGETRYSEIIEEIMQGEIPKSALLTTDRRKHDRRQGSPLRKKA